MKFRVFLAALIFFISGFNSPILALEENELTEITFNSNTTVNTDKITLENNVILSKLDIKNINNETVKVNKAKVLSSGYNSYRNYHLWDLLAEEKSKTVLKGGVQEYEEQHEGFLLLNERVNIIPEMTTGINLGTSLDSVSGGAGRFRTQISALIIKDKKNGKIRIGEGRLNIRANMSIASNPLLNGSLSNVNDLYSEVSRPNSGINIGEGSSTKIGFIDNLNYTQKVHIHGIEWTQAYGFMDLKDYFDRNAFAEDIDTQFINSTFNTNRVIAGNVSALSGLWKFKRPMAAFTINASVLDPLQFDNAFSALAEFDVSPKIKGKQGNYRFGVGAMLGRRVNDYFFHNGAEYLYLNFDQKITDKIGIFARYGNMGVGYAKRYPFFFPVEEIATHKDNNVVKEGIFLKERAKSDGFNSISDYFTSNNYGANGLPVRQTISFGMEWDKPFGYKKGCIAMAYGQNYRIYRGSATDSAGHPVFAYEEIKNRAPEHVLELDYRHNLNKFLTITPNFQLILHKAGNRDNKPSVVFGLRSYLHF